MSFGETVLLSGIAGFTIYLGLPVGRLQLVSARTRVALAMFSVGILVFLLVDVLGHGFGIVEEGVEKFEEGEASFGHAAWLSLLLIGGFATGSAGLGILERRMRAGGRPEPIAGGSTEALAHGDEPRFVREASSARVNALRTGMIIAAAIGVHNLAEGLAIGVSAQAGEVQLATVLVIGFALHNATEGFGIVGPLGDVIPSWSWLGLAGLIGGAPVLVGAILGYNITSEPLELAAYALAGGAILYVVGEIWSGMRRYGYRELGLLMLAAGFAAGVLTDLVVEYGGG